MSGLDFVFIFLRKNVGGEGQQAACKVANSWKMVLILYFLAKFVLVVSI